MICGCNNYSERVRSAQTQRSDADVTGTLDFKWPRLSRIRVAVQQSKQKDLMLEAAIEALDEQANAWNAALGGRLELQLVGGGKSRLPAPKFPNQASSAPDPDIDYDVLVSLSSLPLQKQANAERPERSVKFPSSSLGTYCRRAWWGTPTLYAGEPPAYVGGAEWLLGRTWFESNEFRFVLIHELGHVLGLVHEHQNPNRGLERFWKSVSEVVRIVQATERVRVDETYVNENIVKSWPGHAKYSEWQTDREWAANPKKATEINSVMTKPRYQCLLAGSECSENGCKYPKEHANFAAFLTPTAWDVEQLKLMYPDQLPQPDVYQALQPNRKGGRGPAAQGL